ncbi:MAG: hypothetical protein ACOYJC_05845 [Christensenellales bacterium]|jgi:hypothetical protein
MKKTMSFILALILALPAFAGCVGQQAPGSDQTNGGDTSGQTAQSAAPDGGGWEDLFTYDEGNAMQLTVKTAISGEEDAYGYPWGGYDDPIELSEEGAYPSEDAMDADGKEKKIQEALSKLPPEKRKATEEAMRKGQEQNDVPAQGDPELPPDWNYESNQPRLGGRLELQSGGDTVMIEMSEYCVDADTTFTVTPIKESKLPQEFMKGGFSLTRNGKSHVTLGDYAVITFITKNDPGEDVVIKIFGANGEMEYAFAEVVKLGNTYVISGAVEHFPTVEDGVANLPTLAPGVSPESTEKLRKFAEEQVEEMRRQKEQGKAGKKLVKTIEFDEILYTNSAAGHPLQLHLRAKLVQQESASINAQTGLMERPFTGKIWIKFYTWMPGGYGVMYMLCNNAVIRDPAINWVSSLTEPGTSRNSFAIQMASTGGSQSVGEGVGSFDISGKTYSSVQTDWVFNADDGSIQVTFTSMKGAMDKTFITGKVLAKTERQSNKKLKWFLD